VKACTLAESNPGKRLQFDGGGSAETCKGLFYTEQSLDGFCVYDENDAVQCESGPIEAEADRRSKDKLGRLIGTFGPPKADRKYTRKMPIEGPDRQFDWIAKADF